MGDGKLVVEIHQQPLNGTCHVQIRVVMHQNDSLRQKKKQSFLKAGYTLIAKFTKMIVKCEKRKVYSMVFCVTFFAFHISHQGHSSEKSKNFVVYFFSALIKQEICMVCFAKKLVGVKNIDMYRYFQNIDPLFNIFKISICIEKFWRKVGNFVQIFRHSKRKFRDCFASIFGKTCEKLSEKREIMLRKFWNNLEKL